MKHKKWLAAGLALFSAFTLAACSNGGNNSSNSEGTTAKTKLPASYKVGASGTTAGNNSTLKVAEVNDSPFAGIASPALATNAEDNHVYAPGNGNSLFNVDSNYKIVDGGLANLRLDRKTKTATITLRDNAKWSNGSKVTAMDVVYPYEIIGAKKSPSQQYSADMNNIIGMAEYHDGKAKSISGITMPDGAKGRVVKIKFTNFPPSLQYSGNSYMWASVEPYEYYKGTALDKLTASPQVRKNPIFTGPYKLEKQTQGESTSWVPNPYYYGPKPKIKHIDIQVISTSNALAALKAKKFDITSSSLSNNQYPEVKKLSDYVEVGSPAYSISYFGFNLGHTNNNGISVMDKNAKLANKNLRQALMYAIDIDAVTKKFSNGLSWRANTLLPPAFKQYYDASLPGFPYNAKKAEKLLDEAGYKKKGKWRVQPNGKPLKINFGAMQSSDSTVTATYQYFIQQWHKIGLDVQFATGKPIEMNSFYSTLQKPKQNVMDFYLGSFGTGSEPTPTGLWGSSASFNMGHFADKKNDELMAQLNDEKAWNNTYRVNKFKEWQKYMNDQTGYAPYKFSTNWYAVNKRVMNYTTDPSGNNGYGTYELNAANPQ